MPNVRPNRWKFWRAWFQPCAAALAVWSNLQAQDVANRPFIVKSWNNREGLPQSSVISIVQTRDGYLWLGTLNGLVRFDGIDFAVFDENNTPGLGSGRIVRLFEDSHTNLWVGTDTAGVALIHDGQVKTFNLGSDGHEGRLTSVCEDSSGGVWLYTADAHLGRYRAGRMEVLDFRWSAPAITRLIAAGKSGPVWVAEYEAGGKSGLFSFQPANFNPPALAIDQSISAQRIDFILASQDGGIWRLMDGRIEKWAGARRLKDLGPYPWGAASVTSACEDKDGNLIVGTGGAGVFWSSPGKRWRQISTTQGLSSDYALSLCMDRGGNLWVGTDGGGLDRVTQSVFNMPDSSHPFTAQSLSEDENGGIWAAFNAHGLTLWRSNSFVDFPVGLGSNAWSVLVGHNQHVWAGTRFEGLFEFANGSFAPASSAAVLGPQIFALFEDRTGGLWAGTQAGLANWDGHRWKIFTTADGLSGNIVRAITQDTNGDLWIGTENQGLNRLQDGKFVSYQASEQGLPGNDISCLCADLDGVLWVGTSGHGLARFENGKWTRYSTDNGLASNFIDYLLEDREGHLWLGSNMGLMRILKRDLNNFAEGKTSAYFCRTFVENDGLPTRECTGGSEPAALRARDGSLWFPTAKGVALVNPSDIKPNARPPVVMIESVKVDGREQKTNALSPAWSQSVVIPPGREQLEIDYTALNFSAPDAVHFKYRLEGRDKGWTDAHSERVANYSNLTPGHYQFHVIAVNEDGVQSDPGSTLDITVEPQFWQTNWFRAALVLFIVGLIAGAVRYVYIQKLRRQAQLHKQQEDLEHERARIARDLHDQIGANLTQVALLGEMAETDKELPAEIEQHAQQIATTARETTRALDQIVWAVNPANDTLEGLANYACKYAQEYLALAGLRYRADVPAHLPATAIAPDIRHHAFLAFKEAVNNVVKHAKASEAWIRLRLSSNQFILEVEDNGCGLGGMDPKAAQMRNGLRNMRNRMEAVGGEFSIGPGDSGGSLVRLTVPIKNA